MDIIANLITKAEKMADGMDGGNFISEVINDYDVYFDIIDMNINDQLYKRGVTSLGDEIAEYDPYSPYTVLIKEAKGQPTDRVTLKDTGAFHGSFFIDAGSDSFEIYASDEKTAALVDRYGLEIFGLTDENKAKLSAIMLPKLAERAQKILFYGE